MYIIVVMLKGTQRLSDQNGHHSCHAKRNSDYQTKMDIIVVMLKGTQRLSDQNVYHRYHTKGERPKWEL